MQVIQISGKQGSGKTTTAAALGRALVARGCTVAHYKFAAPMYAMADMVYQALGQVGAPQDSGDPAFKRLLQILGVWGRESFGSSFWADLARKIVERHAAEGSDSDKHFAIFDDCRFPEELAAFPGAYTLRLWADRDARKARADRWRETEDDVTETALDGDIAWSRVLCSDGGPGGWTTEQIVERVLDDLGVSHAGA